ncbi:glycosyltransferase family 4 protein [archaeon]|nr:glycosyltransferase family 4 protein [archaeon]MBL7057338.1 glycosyltransferase family 4 protein [Candidatus Woesearchaeota archaeon]
MSKKLLRICHKFLVDSDGYEVGIQDLVTALSKNFDSYVMFFIPENQLSNYVKKNELTKKGKYFYHKKTNCTIVPIIYERKNNVYVNDLFMRKNIASFKRQFNNLFNDISPDIVHIHGTLAPQFLHAAKHAKEAGKKVFATHHIGLINRNCHNQRWYIVFAKFFIHNQFPSICDKVLCLSHHGKDSFMNRQNVIVDYGAKPVKKVNYSMNKINALLNKHRLSDGLINLKEKEYLVYPARYNDQKNQLMLVEAAKILKAQGLKIKILCIGSIFDKDYFVSVQRKIKHHKLSREIILVNKLSHDEVLAVVNKAEFMISPSINEGLGRSSLEALSLGVPILVSRDSGHMEYLVWGINGLHFNPRNKKSIAEAIKHAKKMKVFHMDHEIRPYSEHIAFLKRLYNKNLLEVK